MKSTLLLAGTSMLAFCALVAAPQARAADAVGNGDTRNVNKPTLILQAGRTF